MSPPHDKTKGTHDVILLTIHLMLMMTTGCHGQKTSLQVRGAGASFPSEVYKSWIRSYSVLRQPFVGVEMTYEAVGSGSGKTRIKQPVDDLDVEYAGSDSVITDSEYEEYPDLQMLPTIAGAVVLAYNLPDITDLVLSRDLIVGIYNGTYTKWDDPDLQDLNPDVSLPVENIEVFARMDKSGTTEIFTKALSSFSPMWENTYGYFSQGVDDNGTHSYWNNQAVSLLGKGTLGISGLILTFSYSIGYLSVSDAVSAGLTYARIVNKAGNVVEASTENVQNAMEVKSESFNNRFAVDLVDADGEYSYPISSYTYLILRMDSFTDCDVTIELYRYIEWFISDADAHTQCSRLQMVPLSSSVADKVLQEVLESMQCGGESVSKLVEDQKYKELISTQTWRLPLYIASPIICVLLVSTVAFLVWQQVKLNRAIWKKEYLIPEVKVKLLTYHSRAKSMMSTKSLISLKSRISNIAKGQQSNTPSRKSSTTSDKSDRAWLNTMMNFALYDEHEVCLRQINLTTTDQLRHKTKKCLLAFRDKTHHLNVLTFFGLTCKTDKVYMVSGCCNKGILRDILQNEKFKLDVNFKYSMSGDVAAGMEFLHKQGMVHGSLTSSNCYIDSRWTVKIADWELYSLRESQNNSKLRVTSTSDSLDKEHTITARNKFWIDPDLLSCVITKPTTACDVYSFSIILVEIFTREDPYDELTCQLEPEQIVNHVITKHIRPQIPEEVSGRLRTLISECWHQVSERRPDFAAIVKRLKSIQPSKKSVLDCMMAAVESYAADLEDKVHERTLELAEAMKKTEDLLHQMLPPSVVTKLARGEIVEPESVDCVTIFFSDIVGFTTLSSESTPLQIVRLLNDLYTTFDSVIDKHEVYKVETIGDAYMVISGLPKRNGDRHAACIADMAIEFAFTITKFEIHHLPERALQLRAGIHSGPVAAGVVGLKMPRYCLFGDTVNTASRMESTSVAMKIQCSDSTKSILDRSGGYILNHRGQVSVKGKGTMDTYWLHGKLQDIPSMPSPFLRDITQPL